MPRLPALTGLRMLAALVVYFSHVGAPAGSPAAVVSLFASGYNGVTLFFVLSGFVLWINYADALRRRKISDIYNYAVARFARIYPLYILVLGYLVIRAHAQGVPTLDWWQNAVGIHAWSPSLARAYSFNGPSWSISVEFFLYACFPLLALCFARLKRPRTTLIIAATVVLAMVALAAWFTATGRAGLPIEDPASAHRWLYRTPITRLGDFVLGILAASLYMQVRNRPVLQRAGGTIATAAAVTAIGLMAWPALLNTAWSWDVAYAIPAAILIFGLAVSATSRLAAVLSLPAIVLLGEASYAFYLIHVPAVAFLGGAQWASATTVSVVLFELLTLGIIVALAVGIHILIERPSRLYIRRALTRRDRRLERASAQTPEPAVAPISP